MYKNDLEIGVLYDGFYLKDDTIQIMILEKFETYCTFRIYDNFEATNLVEKSRYNNLNKLTKIN